MANDVNNSFRRSAVTMRRIPTYMFNEININWRIPFCSTLKTSATVTSDSVKINFYLLQHQRAQLTTTTLLVNLDLASTCSKDKNCKIISK